MAPEATAVVWALPAPGFDPWARLGGLSLIARAALTLASARVPSPPGERRAPIVIVVSPDDEADVTWLQATQRPIWPTKIVTAASPAEAARALLGDLGPEIAAPFVLAPAYVAGPRGVDEAVLSAAVPAGAIGVRVRAGRAADGPVLASAALLEAIAARDDATLDDALAALDVPSLPAVGWCERVDTEAGRRAAFRELFEACRKPVDGIVSTNLNRHVSIWISKRIVDLPISPNAVTIVTFFIGVAGAALCARGTYAGFLAGAACMQANSILDGVDGELARVRFQHSKIGQWLDTIADDVSNALYYVGIGVGALSSKYAPWSTVACAVAVGALVLTVAQYYVELVRLGSGDFYALGVGAKKGGLGARVVSLLERVLKKDLFLFLYLVLAVFGVLPAALFVAALGHLTALVGATSTTLRRAFSGRARA
ncbi:MAG TPA: CDP-alcohol phosphatidyltransferase family protein [Byssovorax sp.]|jgi:CDP-L-myo-inositol myo-inositolphosphotransferase